MNISEEDLRAMVRDAIARQGGPVDAAPIATPARVGPHPSHYRLALVGGGDADGRCIIEPAVPCTHCGFCQSLGH
jgi:hypothetical protein